MSRRRSQHGLLATASLCPLAGVSRLAACA
jgi:hypothetical protein